MATAPVPNPTPPSVTGTGVPATLKPGYQTSEFWLAVLTVLGSLGVSVYSSISTRPPGEAGAWAQDFVNKLAPIVAMVVSWLVSSGYINRRVDLKQALVGFLAAAAKGEVGLSPATISSPTSAPSRALASGTFLAMDASVVYVENGMITQLSNTVSGK